MVRWFGMLLVAGLMLEFGCAPRDEKPTAKEDVPAKKAGPALRKMEISEARLILNKLRIAQERYFEDHQTAPEKWQDFTQYYDNVERIDLVLRDEWVTFIWGVDAKKLSQNPKTVLAYETEAGPEGLRAVLYADGTIEELNRAAFEKAPKIQGK